MFSKKATKIDQIFTVDLMFTKCQIEGGDFFNLCGLLRKHELYLPIGKISHSLLLWLILLYFKLDLLLSPLLIQVFFLQTLLIAILLN